MKHILIVDDEPTVRLGLAKLVRQYSPLLSTVAVANGADALNEIQKQRPDIVLTDIHMPRMDGLELCSQVQELHQGLSIAVISGYDDFKYAQKCLTYGVKEYLLKPVTEHELYPVLDKLLLQSAPAPISIYKVEAWLEQVEAAIWSLEFKTLVRLLEDWKQEEMTAGIPVQQLALIITDGLKILVKKLNARGMASFSIHESATPPPQSAAETMHYLESELVSLYNQLFLWRGGNQKNVFEEAKAYMDSHISEELSLEEVAEKMGLAPTYFSYMFKKMTNETFIQYRMRKRIERAKQLLELPHYKVVDVGIEIGYQSYPYFTKIFKKMTGCSPTEYRSMLGIK
ncbi:response regulator transcription factor [Paenibacillus rigui]|uniref:DNA-binding response regulator n=1 Tax=Paenibacillus rigui TaxID=554312 RepID=A0A229UPW6_9BACL|nr:response regulator [Paenibacillus rigui]OXM85413.1 DNA-binding response regulator [Paenibacillus rigui]